MSGPVIAVSGPPGSGKSTLTRMVAARLGLARLEYDQYETLTRRPPDAVLEWLSRGAPYDEIDTPGLPEALRSAAARGPVLFDTPLGRAHPQTGALIDLAVWIECPLDLALARKIAQLAADVPADRAIAFVAWLQQYVGSYDRFVRPACVIQAERLRPGSDISLDATLPLQELEKSICDNIPMTYGTFPVYS